MGKTRIITAFLSAVTAASMLATTASAAYVPEGYATVFDMTPTVEGSVESVHIDLGGGYGKTEYYYLDKNGERLTGYKLVYADRSDENDLGSNMRMCAINKETGKLGSYYTGFTKNSKGRRYYIQGERVYGWYKVGNYWYHFDENGYADTGRTKICGAYYSFDEKGRWTGKVSKNGVAPEDFRLYFSDINDMGGFDTDGIFYHGQGWKYDDSTGDISGSPERYETDMKFSGRDRQVMYCMFLESGILQSGKTDYDDEEEFEKYITDYAGADALTELSIELQSEPAGGKRAKVTLDGKTYNVIFGDYYWQLRHLDNDVFKAYCFTENIFDYYRYFLSPKYPDPEGVFWDMLE